VVLVQKRVVQEFVWFEQEARMMENPASVTNQSSRQDAALTPRPLR
jgi:hypothetical protein